MIPVHWHHMTRWDDPDLPWIGEGDVRIALLDIGAPSESDRPLVMVVEYAPDAVIPAHYHDSDYCSIVVRGEVEVTGRNHTTGSVRRVAAGTAYGPLIAGREGTTLIDIFTDRDGATANWLNLDPEDQAFAEVAAQALRDLVAELDGRPRLTSDR